MVFITASPLLARNVGKLYHRVLAYLKCLLRDKEKAKAAKDAGDKDEMVPEEKKDKEIVVEEKKTLEDEFEVVGDEDIKLEKNESQDENAKRLEEGTRIVNEALEDFDMKILDDAEKEIEQMVEDINVDDDRSEVPNSFYKVGIDDFPLFLTLREFLYLMDSLMGNSFFMRNIESMIRAGIKKTTGKKGYYRQKENSSGNRIYDNIIYREVETKPIDVEISSDDDEEHEVVRTNDMDDGADAGPILLSDTIMVRNEDLVSEVDYEDFKDIFYPEFLEKLKAKKGDYKDIPPQMIWQKIRNMDLHHRSLNETYDATEKLYFAVNKAYKEWKQKTGNYDLNDLYMHMNKFYENDLVANNLIDFLFIDEIQDIPIHLLTYLRRFGSKYFYLSGDNAQNISKGVSFKFQDLANTFNSYRRRRLRTQFHTLTINYRSHEQILALGNNIVLLIRLLFPQLIEYLPPEESPTTGAKPMMIPLGQKIDSLINFMQDNMGLKVELPSDMENKEKVYKFVNGQVFITRDYRGKQALLARFPNCIALTILEAKGMEFDDVILYNYFTDSDSHKPVMYFSKALNVTKTKTLQKKEMQNTRDRTVYYKPDSHGGFYEYEISVDITVMDRANSQYDQSQLNDTADELKLLYVAITRARKRVLIFDEVGEYDTAKHSRSFFDQFWREQGLIEFSHSPKGITEFKDSAPFEKVKERKKWIRDGIEYLEKGIYEYAELCFKSAELEKGYILASYCKLAHQLKKDAYLLDGVESSSQTEQEEIILQRKITKEKLMELGNNFLSQGWSKQALQCYSIAGNFKHCAEILKSEGQYERAADYYLELGSHEDAFECYKLAKDYLGMMNCLHVVKEPKQILDLYQLIKEKLPKEDKPKITAMAKRKLREMLLEYNFSLLSDELPTKKDLDLNIEDLNDEENKDESVAIIPDLDVKKQSKELIPADTEEVQPSDEMVNDDALSFEVVDMDDVMSNKCSFEFVKSEIDELEKLSESFIGVSIQDKKIFTNPSLFEEIDCLQENKFTFREIQILIKSISMMLDFYDEFIKKPKVQGEEEAEKVYELDMIELTETTCLDIITFLEESGAHSLRILLEHKVGFKKHILGLLISYLHQTSSLHVSFVEPQSRYLKDNVWATINGNYNENRRLATMSFLTVLQKFDQKILKELFQNADSQTKADMMMIMMLGYFRQLIHLLPQKDACTVLATFAEVQMLIMLKVNSNEVDLFDKEAVFTDLFLSSGVKKLAIIFSNFEEHSDIIHCSLLYFSSHYLWEKKTYEVANFDEILATVRSPFLRRGLGLIKKLHDKNFTEAFKEVLNLNNSKISLTNTLEAGYYGGILLMCFYFNLKFFDSSMVLEQDFSRTHYFIKPLMNYFKEDILLKSTRNKFVEGMMLAMGISLVNTECPALAFLASFGLLVHRNSHFLKLIADPKTSPKDVYYYSREPLTVADCGQEFYALPFNYVLDCLNQLCKVHQDEISRLSLPRKEDQSPGYELGNCLDPRILRQLHLHEEGGHRETAPKEGDKDHGRRHVRARLRRETKTQDPKRTDAKDHKHPSKPAEDADAHGPGRLDRQRTGQDGVLVLRGVHATSQEDRGAEQPREETGGVPLLRPAAQHLCHVRHAAPPAQVASPPRQT
jgi:hypothetical protein